MAGVADITAVWSPAAPQPWSHTGSCDLVEVKMRYCVKYIVTIVFDFAVLLLTFIGVRRMGGSRIGEVLVDHGIVYFVATAAVNLVVCVLTILQLSPQMSLAAAPASSAVSILAATRLYVALHREANARHSTAITLGQLASSSAPSRAKRVASLVRKVAGVRPGSAHAHAAARPTVVNVDVSYITDVTNVASTVDLEKGTPTSSKMQMEDH